MSSHEEGKDEEVVSSPLSSPRSSIFELDEFDYAWPPREQAPGPALTDFLPPFNPASKPSAESARSSSPGFRRSSLDALRDEKRPSKNDTEQQPPDTIDAHSQDIAHNYPHMSNSQDAPATEHLPATPISPGPAQVDGSTNCRKRKAPETTSTAKRKVVVRKPRKNDPKRWQAPFVFTDSKSPLVTASLRAILLHPKAWDVLSPGDQAELRAMLAHDGPASLSPSPPPPGPGPQLPDGEAAAVTRPNLDYLRSDDSFRFDCARYSENIEEGRHDPDWLAESWIAHERRKRGDFKEYLVAKLERDWEVELPREEESDGVGDAGEETKESPVASSVGEGKFTGLNLEVAPADEKPGGEAGRKVGGEEGEIVV